jgi:hypothetical protein
VRKYISFIIQKKLYSSFDILSDRETIKEKLKEIIDSFVKELLQPKENELMPRSD